MARSIQQRRLEIDTLLSEAEKCEQNNSNLYAYLCRACCVLIASHLEGFLKDLTRSLLLDFSYNLGSFRNLPRVMKRSFASRIVFFDGVEEKEIDRRVNQLISFFDKNSVPVEMDAFSYRENTNRNATASFIDLSLSKIGVPNAIYSLSKTPLTNMFDNDSRTNIVVLRDLRRFQAHLYSFPYRILPPEYNFDYNASKGVSSNTIWHTLIEEVMSKRHVIAHGDTMEMIATHNEIGSDIQKVDVFMHGIMHSASSYLVKDM